MAAREGVGFREGRALRNPVTPRVETREGQPSNLRQLPTGKRPPEKELFSVSIPIPISDPERRFIRAETGKIGRGDPGFGWSFAIRRPDALTRLRNGDPDRKPTNKNLRLGPFSRGPD